MIQVSGAGELTNNSRVTGDRQVTGDGQVIGGGQVTGDGRLTRGVNEASSPMSVPLTKTQLKRLQWQQEKGASTQQLFYF